MSSQLNRPNIGDISILLRQKQQEARDKSLESQIILQRILNSDYTNLQKMIGIIKLFNIEFNKGVTTKDLQTLGLNVYRKHLKLLRNKGLLTSELGDNIYHYWVKESNNDNME